MRFCIKFVVLNRPYSTITGHVIQTESRDNETALPLVGVLVTGYGRIYYILSIISIKNEKLSNSNNTS